MGVFHNRRFFQLAFFHIGVIWVTPLYSRETDLILLVIDVIDYIWNGSLKSVALFFWDTMQTYKTNIIGAELRSLNILASEVKVDLGGQNSILEKGGDLI